MVNYDFPNDVETYVHRIGRSGRNGKLGKSFTLVTDRIFSNPNIHRELLKVVKESGNSVPANLNYYWIHNWPAYLLNFCYKQYC